MNNHQYSALHEWQNSGQTTSLLGHDIFYIDSEGNAPDLINNPKPTLLLIHGFPTSSWDWQPMWQTLTANYRVVCLDLLGFGFSEKPNKRNYSILKQADIIEALVTHLGLNTFHVLAHDYGDTVAQELLARQTANNGVGTWLSCCFLNGGLFAEMHRPLVTQKLLLSPFGKIISFFLGKAKFEESMKQIFGKQTQPSQQVLDEFWYVINFNNGKHIFHNAIIYLHDRKRYRDRWVNAMTASPVPIALINGSVDPISGAHMVEHYQKLQCRLDYKAQLETIGHYPQVEQPEQVLSHYLTFLSRISVSN